MHNSPFRYGQHHSQHMEKQRAAFPHPANSVAHSSIRRGVIHITHNAGGGGIPLFSFYFEGQLAYKSIFSHKLFRYFHHESNFLLHKGVNNFGKIISIISVSMPITNLKLYPNHNPFL